jgi:prolipoprotein diacylglyceryl transferase
MFLFVHWNIDPEILHFFGFPLRYYSVMFLLAFIAGYRILQKIYVREGIAPEMLDKLVVYIASGALLGARLGHCLFYDWAYFRHHIAEIFLPVTISPAMHVEFTGYQGLASHGGAVGIILAALLYARKYSVNTYWLLDRLAVVCPLSGFFIRTGNLFNSEIIGTPSCLPWAFVFERVDHTPRHPAQLYEGIGYLLVFLVLWLLYKKKNPQRGYLFSLFLILVFVARFTLEFLKQDQVAFEQRWLLDMGQILSIPFIVSGIYLQIKVRNKYKYKD